MSQERSFIWVLIPVLSMLLWACVSGETAQEPVPEARPNVLFIAIDDLNNDLAALGVEYVRTPHLDAFASSGRLFSRHFVQVPSCGPSRAALLRGMRPTERAHLPNSAILQTHEDWGHKSLPRWFRDHGYATLSLGKITHHPGGLTGEGWAEGPEELPGAWDRVWVPESPWKTPEDMMHGYANGVPRDRGTTFASGSPAWEAYDGPDESYPDAWVADEAIQMLDSLAGAIDPWFFAVGFFKPHLPFAAPRRYHDIYETVQIPAPVDTRRHPAPSSWHPSGEMFNNYGHETDPRQDEAYALTLRRAYAASTSYVDAQVGRVLETVDRLGLGENTIIVVWSDHGFALGHQGVWGKHALYEAALKSPLMIRYPGISRPGVVSSAIVEAIDIFPTLTDLAGLPAPEGLHGKSLRPQLENPATPGSNPAFGFSGGGQTTVRVEEWRLIMHSEQGAVQGFELFDFKESTEGVRVDPVVHPEVVDRLRRHMEDLPWISN